MKRLIQTLPILTIITLPIIGYAAVTKLEPMTRHPKVIYGDDDRYDIEEYSDSTIYQAAEGVAALFHKYNLKDDKNGGFRIISRTYGKKFNLCKDEPFHEQLAASSCTGFLIAPKILLTAAHCLKGREQGFCKSTRWVFGYDSNKESIPKEDVYRCSKVIKSAKDSDSGIDYALIELINEAKAAPLELNFGAVPELDDELALIGHPSGLPQKVTDNAFIREIFDNYIKIDSDSYAGNSGSPVINKRTGLVEGILIRGEEDFVYDKTRACLKTIKCESDECRGEDFTKLSAIPGLQDFISKHSK